MQDLREANIEISIREDGKVIWVNSEQGCLLRVSGIKNLVLDDRRCFANEKPTDI